MKFKVYSVFDKKLKQYCPPFIQRPDAIERSIRQLVSQSPIPPVDLQLVEFGEWNDETAEFYVTDYVRTEVTDLLGFIPATMEVSE